MHCQVPWELVNHGLDLRIDAPNIFKGPFMSTFVNVKHIENFEDHCSKSNHAHLR